QRRNKSMRHCEFFTAGLVLGVCLLLGAPAAAQPPRKEQPTTLPPVEVEAPRVTPMEPGLGPGQGTIPWSSGEITSDSMPVGPYGQPVWTTQRPFPTVRTYVLPAGQAQVEHWYRPRWKKDGSREDRLLEELAIGLPHRFQLDVYERWNIEQDADKHYQANHEGVMIELRWAVADWGVLPLNPTLYAEWVQRGEPSQQERPDKYELKVLLADSFLNDRLFWAGNFILEKEVGGEKENELGYSQALATTIIERKLLGGVEMWYRAQNVHSDRAHWNNEFLIGPSLQWRPTNRTFLDVVCLFATPKASPDVEMYVVLGFQFGKRAGPGFGGITPASLGQERRCCSPCEPPRPRRARWELL